MIEEQELKSNEYYLVVSNLGDYLKTKSFQEFKNVSYWSGVIFSKKVSSGKYLFYQCGHQTYKKLISQLKIAIPFEKYYWYDIERFYLHGHYKINKIWIGGKQDEIIESL